MSGLPKDDWLFLSLRFRYLFNVCWIGKEVLKVSPSTFVVSMKQNLVNVVYKAYATMTENKLNLSVKSIVELVWV